MTVEGWIKLHRPIIESDWFTDVNTNQLFIYCILRANFEPISWRGIKLDRGQFVTSLDKLSKATGLSVRQVRTSLTKLKTTNTLTSKTSSQNTVITVVSYDKFQGSDKQPDKPATSERQTDDKRATTDKNIRTKEEKELKNIILPNWVPLDAWNAFVEMRINNKSKPTVKAMQMLINKLEKLKDEGCDPLEVLEQSTMNNYKGLFEVKQNGKFNNSTKPTSHDNITAGIVASLTSDSQGSLY